MHSPRYESSVNRHNWPSAHSEVWWQNSKSVNSSEIQIMPLWVLGQGTIAGVGYLKPKRTWEACHGIIWNYSNMPQTQICRNSPRQRESNMDRGQQWRRKELAPVTLWIYLPGNALQCRNLKMRLSDVGWNQRWVGKEIHPQRLNLKFFP